MACLKNPDSEAKRVAAVRTALLKDKRWERGAFYGNVSAAGLRRRSANAMQHGAKSLAVQWAVQYCESVISVLENSASPPTRPATLQAHY